MTIEGAAAAMQSEAAAVVGTHDFRRLSKSSKKEDTVRTVARCAVRFFPPPSDATAYALLGEGLQAVELQLRVFLVLLMGVLTMTL